MKKTLMALAGAAMFAAGIGAAPTALAHDHPHRHDHRGDIVDRYCRDNNGDGRCDVYRRDRARWQARDYNDFYRSHRESIREYYARERARERWQDDDADVVFEFRL